MTNRRDVVKALALAPLAALAWTREEVNVAAERVARLAPDVQQAPKFFTAQEWRTVSVLSDDIFPRDADSGSATDAKVPEFMDFMLNDGGQGNRTSMRAGLVWLDQESQKRFSKNYADAAPADRTKILDDLAWPARVKDELRPNLPWFNSFRNLAASGYFTSRVGYKALGYTGGVANPKWMGSSPAIMQKLGLTYDDWDKKYGRGY